ncbi:hypothetical protein M3P05_12555 [Sansalvadorimonas sp. 2012CJ34-2]|uniref:Uncharacterized protein n=1 Tax=Parendozoicomonas callyspongiae TaxID=2942213 RepID=A0ABT0PHA0_9GAMM|nr:hypothetical protein [Sansalvadorimonas sp. 2012CJ34-2]MCL6270755.1 hypothetical protein [Sansalvadorimonas sp. 2012CJ34-2]
MIEDEELVMSPLCQTLEKNHCAVEILIYKGISDENWVLELEDEFGNSSVWDDLFATDKAALNAALEAIDDEGIEAFIGEPSPESKPLTEEEYAIDLAERVTASLPMAVTPTKALIHNVRNHETQPVKLKPRQRLHVDKCVYLGDEAGIACCCIAAGEPIVSSITHLKLDPKHPLYKELKDYQLKRKARLAYEGLRNDGCFRVD